MITMFALFAYGSPEITTDAQEAGHHEGEKGHLHDAKKAATTTPVDGWAHYGAPFTQAAAIDCKEVIANPDAKIDQVVRVEGRIENVCQKAGCWMVVADDAGKYLRVTMKDYAFVVPNDTQTGAGTKVDVEGKLIKKILDEKTLAHLKSEAKGNPEEVAAQLAPKYEIVATSVSIKSM